MMTTPTPKVSVFMPVYNAGKDLIEAVQSIIDQTFTDFEFVIVNDGSTDNSMELLQKFNDSRIRIIHNDGNKGLIASLNIGLELCLGEYIVRMDQDDISLPTRIEKQVEFMDQHPECGLLGSWFQDFGDNIESKLVSYSSDDTQIRIRHLYQTHISHPTALLRNSVIKANNLKFDPNFVHGEDYEFWVRMSTYCKLSNIPELLVLKRDHIHNITNKYAQTMQDTCAKVKLKQFHQIGLELHVEDVDLYSKFADGVWAFNFAEMDKLTQLLEKIKQANEQSRFILPTVYNNYLATKFFHLCYNNTAIGKQGWKRFQSSSLRADYHFNSIEKLKFRIKTLLA